MSKAVNIGRRRLLAQAGGLGGLAVLGAPWSSLAAPEDFAPASGVSLATPRDNLLALIRIQASLREEDVPWWYSGVIYGVEEDQMPRLLFGFEGMEMYWMRHLSGGEFELIGHTVSFLKDARSGEWLREWRNPRTGELLEVPAATQGGGAGKGFHYSERGIRPTSHIAQMPDRPPAYRVLSGGGRLWLSKETEYPPGLPQPRLQRQTMDCSLAEFNDRTNERLNARFASTVFMPWRSWMKMDEHPGHMIWHAAGLKLDSAESLPPAYRARLEREHPDKLTARPQ